jgi:hypothetical protein
LMWEGSQKFEIGGAVVLGALVNDFRSERADKRELITRLALVAST